ncbi:MAG: penicillin-binding protein 2 [Actinomycetota bacterium]
MDRQIRKLGIALTLLFAVLFAQMAYVQLIAADRIKNDPANVTRQIIAEYRVERGLILSQDGRVLAESVKAKDGTDYLYERSYPEGALYSAVTGFYSRVYGRTSLEYSMNPYLSGDAPELAVSNFSDLVLGKPKKGGTVKTTIRTYLQEAAARALGDLPGAVVAVDPGNGDVMAIVANPTYDPNLLSRGTSDDMRKAWTRYNADPDKPLLSRAKDELYLPGSTFKIITTSAAFQHGYKPETTVKNPRVLDLPLTNGTLENFGGSLCNGGSATVTVAEAFKESCNVPFAEIGLDLGAKKLSDQARAFGFCPTDPPGQTECIDPTLSFTVPFETGRFPIPEYFVDNDPLLAFSAIGLDNVVTNPLHMALVGAAIANGGTMYEPRLVRDIRDPQGRIFREFESQSYGQPVSPNTADQVRQLMVNVVELGTGYEAQIPGVVVAGKTGTATNGPGRNPNAWFIAFAPAGPNDVPQIAVAVIVLDGGDLGSEATGGRVAAPIAREVIAAFLRA